MSDNSALDGIDGLDYEEIEQAVMETSRGRWFLAEFARRHKVADTAILLNAIRRLEDQIVSMPADDASASPDAGRTQPPEQPATGNAQAASASDGTSEHDEIAEKLDRTTQLVRRLRNSHKLIGESADKPLRAFKAVSINSTRDMADGDLPGFVGSDDDIFADDSASDRQQRADTGVKHANPGADVSRLTSIGSDTAGQPERLADTSPAEETAAAPDAAGTAGKPKKRIIVIRRPADQPSDIPLVDNAPEPPGDSPTAA